MEVSTPVRFSFSDSTNEAVYFSLRRSYASKLTQTTLTNAGVFRSPFIEPTLFSVLVEGLKMLCSVPITSESTTPVLTALKVAAEGYVSGLLRMCIPDEESEQDLYTRARSYIENRYMDPNLCIQEIAVRLSVSPRSIERAFASRNERFTQRLNWVRAEAAYELVTMKPSIEFEQLATLTGFGSVSSLYRALRERETGNSASAEQATSSSAKQRTPEHAPTSSSRDAQWVLELMDGPLLAMPSADVVVGGKPASVSSNQVSLHR